MTTKDDDVAATPEMIAAVEAFVRFIFTECITPEVFTERFASSLKHPEQLAAYLMATTRLGTKMNLLAITALRGAFDFMEVPAEKTAAALAAYVQDRNAAEKESADIWKHASAMSSATWVMPPKKTPPQ